MYNHQGIEHQGYGQRGQGCIQAGKKGRQHQQGEECEEMPEVRSGSEGWAEVLLKYLVESQNDVIRGDADSPFLM